MTHKQIADECGMSSSNIGYWITKYGLNMLSKNYKLDKFTFEKIDTPEKAYALGFIMCDGSINKQKHVEISCAIADKEVVEFIAGVINSRVHYCYTMDKAKRRFPRARTQKRITDVTRFLGGEKKNSRHYPRVRGDLERFILLGAFDADGCITWGRRKDKNRIWQKVCFNSSFPILEGIQKMLEKNLGISSSIRPKRKEKCFTLSICGRDDVFKFLSFIYPDDLFIILKRKYLKYCALRLELEENGECGPSREYRAEPAEQEGVETNGVYANKLNNRDSIQALNG